MKSIQLLLRTNNGTAQLIARLALGIVMFPHGAQLMLGWFGGYGYTGSMGFFTGTMHIPAFFAFLAIFTQLAGSIALILGVLTRLAALGMAVVMAVAIATVHVHVGFFMNWYGNQKGEGYEYHLLAIGLALIVALHGAGCMSIDRALTSKQES